MPPRFDSIQTGADAGGVRLHVAHWEAPGRPPLVFAHATGFCGMVWRALAEPLAGDVADGRQADRYDVYAHDRRGHGHSDKPAPAGDGGRSGYGLDVFAADLVGLVEALGLRDVYAVGHSGGATEILIAAARRPDLFARVVAIEPIIAPPASEAPNSTNEMSEQARRRRARFGGRAEVVERFGSRPPFASWREEILRDYAAHGFLDLPGGEVELACPPAVEAAQFASAAEVNATAVLPEVACPVLVVNGETSGPQFATMAELALAGLPRARHEVVAGASHFVPMEAPEAVVDLIRSFGKE